MAKNHEFEEENYGPENLPSPTTHTDNIINSDSLFAYESEDFAQKPDSMPPSSLGLNVSAEKERTEALHVKVNPRGNLEGGSKNLFERVFSEDDEICVLEAMLEFIEKTESDPVANIDEFIKNLSKLGVTRGQLYTKMKRMKGKFKRNAAKERGGHGLKYGDKHKMKVYQLSQKIWGMDTWANDDRKSNSRNKCVEFLVPSSENHCKKRKYKGDDGGHCIYSASEEWIMDQEIESVDREKKRKLDKKMREMQMAELQLFAMRCEYQAEKARIICAARKANL